MANTRANSILQVIRRVITDPERTNCLDQGLLQRFRRERDEAAFEALLRRHGQMVWEVCRAMLANEADAEDAFQATFLILVRKANSIRKASSLASWLHGVAYRTARKAQTEFARRHKHEALVPERAAVEETDELTWREVRHVLHQELNSLPERLRAPLVLCYLQGMTQDQAAAELGLALGTLKGRLERGRDVLRGRLIRRGLGPAAALLAAAWPASNVLAEVSASLVASSTRVAATMAAGQAVAGLVPARVAALTTGVLKAMFLTKVKIATAVLVLVGFLCLAAYTVSPFFRAVGQTAEKLQEPRLKDRGEPKPPANLVDRATIDARPDADPLPPGAVVRLGTLRLRQPGPHGSTAFSPNGKWLASWGSGGLVQLSEVATGKTLIDAQTGADKVLTVGFTPDGKSVTAVTVTSSSVMRWWMVWPENKLLSTIKESQSIGAAAYSPDSKRLATGSIQLWDAATGKEIRKLPGPDDRAEALLFSPNGRYLARAGQKSAGVWDLTKGKEQRLPDVLDGDPSGLAFSPDSAILAVSNYSKGTVRLWDTAAGKERLALPDKEFGTRAVAFSPDGKILAHGGEAGLIHLRAVESGKATGQLKAGYNIYSLAFSPDGKTIAASMALFQQRKTRLWDLATGKELFTQPRHEQRIDTFAFSADGKAVVTASVDQTIRVWEAATGKHLFQVGENQPTDERAKAPPCAFSPDSKALITARKETIRLWNVSTGKEFRRFESLEDTVLALAISPDGKMFAALSIDRKPAPDATDSLYHNHTIHVRDLEGGKLQYSIPGLDSRSKRLAYSPDGKFLAATTHSGKSITLFDAATGKPVRSIKVGTRPIPNEQDSCFAFSLDGKTLAACDDDQKVHFWETGTGKLLRTLKRPEVVVQSLAFSPNGKVLAAVGWDQRRLFEVVTGRVLWRNSSYEGFFSTVAFSADGKRLATAGDDATALIWELTPDLIAP